MVAGTFLFATMIFWRKKIEDSIDVIPATKDQLLACTCDSTTHIHIVVKFGLVVPDQEVVHCLSSTSPVSPPVLPAYSPPSPE